jgi:hypothetical protein
LSHVSDVALVCSEAYALTDMIKLGYMALA